MFLGLLGGLGSVFILKDFEQIMNQPEDSDAIMTKGIVAILINVLSNQAPKDIATAKLDFIKEIGLKDQLSPTR